VPGEFCELHAQLVDVQIVGNRLDCHRLVLGLRLPRLRAELVLDQLLELREERHVSIFD